MRSRVGENLRKNPSREVYKKFLIVCEGEKTEINYFSYFKSLFHKHNIKVIPFKGENTHADGIVEDAINKIKESKKEGNPINIEKGDIVWCVFDSDRNSVGQLNRAKDLANKHKIKIIFSNPCFEIWYIFHFTNSFGARNTSDDAKDEVKSHLKDNDYHKDKDIYEKFKQEQHRAINKAKDLIREHAGVNIQQYSKYSNPSTNVHEIVCYLESLLINLNI